ncbi:hypothetical protein J3R83DRAFT_12702, partial [Lanmaoa asiatica]
MDQPPHLPPDFALPGFEGLVMLTMGEMDIEREAAIQLLTQCWAQGGAEGIQPRQAPCLDPPRPQAPLATPAVQPPAAEDQPIVFNPDFTVSTVITSRPADYAIRRIETCKYVPLWYFTREGLCEAARMIRRADNNDTLDLTQTVQGSIVACSANSLAASKNTKLDHQLAFSEFLFTRNLFLTVIQNANWGEATVDAFNWFFHHLENHIIREEGDRGERALLHYAHRVHLDWHDKLKQRKAYNIGIIKDELVDKIARELDSKEVRSNLDQASVSLPSTSRVFEQGRQPTSNGYQHSPRSTSPRPYSSRSQRPARQRSYSRECHRNSNRFTSPHRQSPPMKRTGHSDGKPLRTFHSPKPPPPPPICPKCLGKHDERPDKPPCNASFLWDNSEPTSCTRDQHNHLLNKNGQVLCWDFQQPRSCSGKGHNHECSSCGNPSHGAQDCPCRQRSDLSNVK